jgi:hypothetical protein
VCRSIVGLGELPTVVRAGEPGSTALDARLGGVGPEGALLRWRSLARAWHRVRRCGVDG